MIKIGVPIWKCFVAYLAYMNVPSFTVVISDLQIAKHSIMFKFYMLIFQPGVFERFAT